MRQEKQLLLDEIKDKIEGSSAIVLTKYQSLTPDLSASFRKALLETGGSFTAVRKRLLWKAAKENGIDLDLDALEGHIGIVVASDDPIPTTKAVFDFAKNNKETLEILAGQFEGRLCSAEEVTAIAKLPSKDEMRAQFLGLLEAPMSQTLSVMEALLTSILHCMENKNKDGSE